METHAVGGVPDVLRRRDEPLWCDLAASQAWFLEHGLAHGPTFSIGPACRRSEAVRAWALANGFGRDDLPKLLDHHKMSALNIDSGWTADAVRERGREPESVSLGAVPWSRK